MKLALILFLSAVVVVPAEAAAKRVAPKRTGSSDTMMEKVSPKEQAPSKEQVLWTATDLAWDFEFVHGYSAPGHMDFGSGGAGDVANRTTLISNTLTWRRWMAMLFSTGIDYQLENFSAPSNLPVPDSLQSLLVPLVLDFRWSEHSMVRLQAAPGFFTGDNTFDARSFNVPGAVAYTWIPNKRFQLGLGLSLNPFRNTKILGGGGFRWQITDRWKLKFLMPEPRIEYRAAPPLHLRAGMVMRGDSYRMGPDFGRQINNPNLRNALVDYQDVRVGGGFSWNIKPLLELNGEGGYILKREFEYHTSGLSGRGGKAPYFVLALRFLFQIKEDPRSLRQQTRDLESEAPWLKRYIRRSR